MKQQTIKNNCSLNGLFQKSDCSVCKSACFFFFFIHTPILPLPLMLAFLICNCCFLSFIIIIPLKKCIKRI